MNKLIKLKSVLLIAACLGLTPPMTAATEIENRKGEVTPPAPPATPTPTIVLPMHADTVVLGSIQLPAEVVKKLDAEQLAEILERQVSVPKSTAEHIFNQEILVPGIVFTCITMVSFLLIYFSFRKRRDMLETVRFAIQSGQTLPASFLEALESKPKPSADGDLRKAVLLIALGLSGTAVLAMGEQVGRAWAVGFIPTLVGVGYLFLWRQSQKRLKAGSNDEQR